MSHDFVVEHIARDTLSRARAEAERSRHVVGARRATGASAHTGDPCSTSRWAWIRGWAVGRQRGSRGAPAR